MHGAAAGLVAVVLRPAIGLARAFAFGRQVTGWRFRLGRRVLALEIAQFVVRLEVCGGQARAAFQADDFHARFAEFGREDAARRADADDDDVRFFGCHGSALPHRGLRLQADHGRPA